MNVESGCVRKAGSTVGYVFTLKRKELLRLRDQNTRCVAHAFSLSPPLESRPHYLSPSLAIGRPISLCFHAIQLTRARQDEARIFLAGFTDMPLRSIQGVKGDLY